MKIIPEASWNRLTGRLKGHTTLVIGRTDAGKTTLVRYLLQRFLRRKEGACLVDADIGQSSLGPPGTISMRVFRNKNAVEDFSPDRMFFAGTLNPSKAFRQMVAGAALMVNAARAMGVKTIIVDTTGLVGGETGKALKLATVKAIRPDDIVAIENENELEHIISALGELKDVRVHRIEVSQHVVERSPTKRIRYRDTRYRSYFRKSRDMKLCIETLEFIFRGRSFDIQTSPLDAGTVVGLNKGEETLALGIYKGMTENTVIMETPLRTAAGITEIIASDIIVKPNPA